MSNNKIFKISIKPKKAHAEAGATEIILFSDAYKFAKDAVEFGKAHIEKIGEDLENWFAPKAGAGTEQQFVDWKSNNPELSVASVGASKTESQKDVEQATINEESADRLIEVLKEDGEFADLIEAFGGEGIYLPIVKKNILAALSSTELDGHTVDVSGLVEMIKTGEISADVFANPKMFGEHFEQLDQIKLGGEPEPDDLDSDVEPEASEELKEVVGLVCLFGYDPETPFSDDEKSDAADLSKNQNCEENEFAAYEKLLGVTNQAIDGYAFDFVQACQLADAISKQFGQVDDFDALIETAKSFATKIMTPATEEKEPEVNKSTPRSRLAEKFAESEIEDGEIVVTGEFGVVAADADTGEIVDIPQTTGKGEFKESEEGETREVVSTHYLESVKNHPVFIQTYESSNGKFMGIANVCRPQLGVTQKSGGWFTNQAEARSEAWAVAIGLIQTNIFETKTLNEDIGKAMIKGIAQRPIDNMDSLLVDDESLTRAIDRSKEAEKVGVSKKEANEPEQNQKQESTPKPEAKSEPEKTEKKEKKETAADRKKREKAEADAIAKAEAEEAQKEAEKNAAIHKEKFESDLSELNEKIDALLPGESLVIDDLSDELYHASEGWSKSSLDTINRDPSLVIWQKNAPVDEDKLSTFEIGKALHTAVLEPHKLADEYAVAPSLNMRTNEGKAEFLRFNQENAHKIVLSEPDAKMVDFMARSVLAHPTANKLFSADDGKAEVSIWWRDPKTGIIFKCRPDWMCTLFGQKFIVDLKSVANVWDFEKSCENFRYHVQDVHYSWIYENVFGIMPIFAFCAVSKTIECGRYPVRLPILDESDKEDGKEALDKNIETLQDCLESNIWGGFETITRPSWAKRSK